MRTRYTDRYAVAVWMPAVFGSVSLWLWWVDPSPNIIRLVASAFWLLFAAEALARRLRTPADR